MLSGGVDSTLLANYLSLTERIDGIRAYYLAFGHDDPKENYAKLASEKTGIPLNIYRMESEHVIPTIKEMIS